MNREDFVKFIPKPTNEDVILYDVSLKDLIDIDVPNEYNKLLPVFKQLKSDFVKLKEEIDIYTKTINQMFLFNPSWSEEKYLQELQDDMKTYSVLYGTIKRKEDEIKITQKKVEAINDKIIVQQSKEQKDNEIRNTNISNAIEENKINLKKNKDVVDVYKNSLRKIEEQIRTLKSDLKILNLSKQQLFRGTYTCFCCGKKIKEIEAGKITNKIETNIQKNTEQLHYWLEEKEKIKNILEYYKEQILNIKVELQNNMNFKRNYKNMYIKKSVEILKLEATKNEYLEKITELNESLKSEPNINSKKFLELKNRIEKYKISLENLKRTKSMKGNLTIKVNKYKEKQIELKEMEKLIIKYLSFLNIYYKIYEQKASKYAGSDYKIKLFKIKNYDIIKILDITYKGIEYSQLSKRDKATVDKNLIEKFDSNI